MVAIKSERDLALHLRTCKENVKDLAERLDDAKREYNKAEHELMEWLEGEGKSMIDYDGIGRFSITKPRLFASCTVEHQEDLFSYLEKEGRNDLIKTTVNSNSLSTFVKEQVLEDRIVPDFINVYYKKGVKIQ